MSLIRTSANSIFTDVRRNTIAREKIRLDQFLDEIILKKLGSLWA
jgi:hypothetical protein